LREFEEVRKGLLSLKKYKSQGKSAEVTVNSKEGNSKDFCLDFVQEFGFRIIKFCQDLSTFRLLVHNLNWGFTSTAWIFEELLAHQAQHDLGLS
jgi:hypothetical protein